MRTIASGADAHIRLSAQRTLRNCHLDDAPELSSCSLLFERRKAVSPLYTSEPLDEATLRDFNGKENPLKWPCVRDLTNGGKLQSHDVELTPLRKG